MDDLDRVVEKLAWDWLFKFGVVLVLLATGILLFVVAPVLVFKGYKAFVTLFYPTCYLGGIGAFIAVVGMTGETFGRS